MKKAIDKIIVLFLTLTIAYIGFCIVDIVAYNPVTVTIKTVKIVDRQGFLKETNWPDDTPLFVSRSDTIIIGFNVIRTRNATNAIERVFETKSYDEAKEYIVGSITRSHSPGSNVVIAEFPVPDSIDTGCNHFIFSRNTIRYKYNFLQRAFGAIVNTPKVQICVN